MAEGLEEESKKSLQMEAELEKQLADFDTERQQMRGQLTKKEERWEILLAHHFDSYVMDTFWKGSYFAYQMMSVLIQHTLFWSLS